MIISNTARAGLTICTVTTFGMIAIPGQSTEATVTAHEVPTASAPRGNDPMDRLEAGLRRKVNRPHVEAGPGFFKSDPVEYSPDQLAKEYKKLFALKLQIEKENKRRT
ncbi:unnamed protein product [Leptosia nina]|uniref:Uncharacterized protein n=1 Tax=Leptosia nina TaxID=320188 RepID=A0AAV1JQ90_9NEOP